MVVFSIETTRSGIALIEGARLPASENEPGQCNSFLKDMAAVRTESLRREGRLKEFSKKRGNEVVVHKNYLVCESLAED